MRTELLTSFLNQSGKLISRDQLLGVLKDIQKDNARDERSFGLILFSVDHFRLINGRFGHANADTVLRRVTVTAKQLLRRKGLIGRWGGDEFLCVLPDADADASYTIADQLRQRIVNLVVPVGSSVTTVTCSFGIASYPDNGTDIKTLLVAADEALYEAKNSGRNRVIHASGLATPVFSIGGIIETALREERVMPAYQPIFDLDTGRVVAEEALARIITTDEKVLAAHEFIDAASQLQLTHKIDRAIVASALQRCADNAARGKKLTIFANVSGSLLRHPELISELIEIAKFNCMKDGNTQTKMLVLEITERELLDDPQSTRHLLTPFLDLGLGLALDDFGSGYSSFQYLADLPVSFLKIDGRLIQRLHESRIRAIVRGIQNTAFDLGLTTLAEYVEHERQANILREMGVNWAQGHYFSKAMVDEKEASIRRHMSVNWAQGYYYRRPQSH